MNRKARLVAGLTCGLILAAILVRKGEMLLLALPTLVYLLAGALQAPTALKLAARRSLTNPTTGAGEPVEIGLTVTNQGAAAVHLALDDPLLPGMKLHSGQPRAHLRLAAGESVELNYTVVTRRGLYTWQTLRGRACDPLGLFEITSEIAAAGHLLVVPAPLEIRPLTIHPQFTAPTAGSLQAGRAGIGTDFWGTREYRPGDGLRRINWRLAGRHPRQYFTNQYEHEAIANFGLILDARRLTGDLALEADLFERMVSAAAALGKNFTRHGNRVSLLVFGKNIHSVPPATGKRQLDLLLRNLACARQGGHLPLATIEHFPTRLFPPRAMLVVLSRVEARDLSAYARLRASGYQVLLISPDGVALAAQGCPASPHKTLAARAARIERRLQLARLQKLGVHTIDWQVDQPLEPLLRAAALQMRHRIWGKS